METWGFNCRWGFNYRWVASLRRSGINGNPDLSSKSSDLRSLLFGEVELMETQ